MDSIKKIMTAIEYFFFYFSFSFSGYGYFGCEKFEKSFEPVLMAM